MPLPLLYNEKAMVPTLQLAVPPLPAEFALVEMISCWANNPVIGNPANINDINVFRMMFMEQDLFRKNNVRIYNKIVK